VKAQGKVYIVTGTRAASARRPSGPMPRKGQRACFPTAACCCDADLMALIQ
jgi:hypothetical protein